MLLQAGPSSSRRPPVSARRGADLAHHCRRESRRATMKKRASRLIGAVVLPHHRGSWPSLPPLRGRDRLLRPDRTIRGQPVFIRKETQDLARRPAMRLLKVSLVLATLLAA